MSEEKATYQNTRKDDATWFLFGGIAFLAFGYGWVMNLYKLITADAVGGMEIARAIGIVFGPLGAVLGYF